MTITIEKYNTTTEAKQSTVVNNVMANKRKMYLCKRSARLETINVDTSTETGNAWPTMTSQQTQQPTTTLTSTLTSASTTTTTNFVQISHQREQLEKIQYQMLEDCGLYPETTSLCVKTQTSNTSTTPPALNSQQKTSSNRAVPLTLTHENCPSCSCTSNCHICCCNSNSSSSSCSGNIKRTSATMSATTTMTTSPWEAFGRQQQTLPPKNSYTWLKEKYETVNDKGSNKAQKQHSIETAITCCPCSSLCNSCSFLSNSSFNSTPSNKCLCRNYLNTSTITNTTFAVKKSACGASIELSSKFENCTESTYTAASSYTNDKCYKSTRSRSTPSTSPSSFQGYSRHFLARHLQTPYAIFEMLIALLTATLHPRCPPFDMTCTSRQQQQQQHYPQMEARLMTHFNNANTNTNTNTNNNDNRYHHSKHQQHHHNSKFQQLSQQTTTSSPSSHMEHNHQSCKMRQVHQPHHHHYHSYRYSVLPNLNTLLMVLSFVSLLFVSSSQALSTSGETTLESSIPDSFTKLPPRLESTDQVKLNRSEKGKINIIKTLVM